MFDAATIEIHGRGGTASVHGLDGAALLAAADAAHARVGAAERELLRSIAELDRHDAWIAEGARDTAHLLSMRYGISCWKARRWIGAAHALETLPHLSSALETGAMSLDKISELARFATPVSERGLIGWARAVSVATIRRRGDLEQRRTRQEVIEPERTRSLDTWYTDDGRFGLEAELPAAQGRVVEQALERLVERVPTMPGEADTEGIRARRADALLALCSARLAADPDPDRATVVVHASLEALRGEANAELESGPVIGPETATRLLCDARIQLVAEDRDGTVLDLTPVRRVPPAWMARLVRHRDRGCTFPGCGTRAFTQAHHIRFWSRGGRTELANLALICSFHHRLVHEWGWGLTREPSGELRWTRPDGTRYRAGPRPRERVHDRHRVHLGSGRQPPVQLPAGSAAGSALGPVVA
ncbi:MAG TPA: DUF222 domain-containing protein [Actinomycetota bacterium]|jgi:hypothetical protein